MNITERQEKNWQIACSIVGARPAYVRRKIAAALDAKDEAAADMLAACRHALTIADEYDETGFAGTIVLKQMLRAAIAKASK